MNACRYLFSKYSLEFRNHRGPLFSQNLGPCRSPGCPSSLELGAPKGVCFSFCISFPSANEEGPGWCKDCKSKSMGPLIHVDR